MKTAIFTLALLAASCAHAARWIEVDDDARLRLTIDADSIARPSPNQVRIWMQYEWKTTRELSPGMPYDSAKVMSVVNCDDSTYRNRSGYFYMKGRTVQPLVPDTAKDAIPGTVMGNVVEALCKQK